MCYSQAASIIAACIDIVGALILFNSMYLCQNNERTKYDNRVFAYALFGISTMQIAEAIIHSDMTCNGTNESGSQLAYFSLLFIQPVFSGLALYFANPERCAKKRDIRGMMYIIWQVLFLIYVTTTAFNRVEGEYHSKLLNKSVTKWCTTDKICEDDVTCSLDWKWDDLNQGFFYTFYFFLVIGLPTLSLKYWEWLVIANIIFFSIGAITGGNIFKPAASCFWTPIATLLIQLSPIPEIVKKCFFKSNIRYELAQNEDL